LTFAHAADGEPNAAGEEDEHEPIEREYRPRHPPEIAAEEECGNDEQGSNGCGDGKCDEVARSYVTPGPAVHAETFQGDYAEEYDVWDRQSELAELAGRQLEVEPQQECGEVGDGCENEVGSDDDRAPVARGNGGNT
jgi:hypothetical protein